MSGEVVGLVAAAALLASVGVANAADHATANAKGPVKLTDNMPPRRSCLRQSRLGKIALAMKLYFVACLLACRNK